MRHAVSTVCLVLLVLAANLAFAQAGQVCLFSDRQGVNCSIRDATPGLLSIYVVHTQAGGVKKVRFSAPKPGCMTGATWLSDTDVFPNTTGDTQTGVSVTYGSCLASPIHVLTISYFAQGMTPADCPYEVLPHPSYGRVAVTDCNDDVLDGEGSTTFINSNLPCTCNTGTTPQLFVSPTSLDFGLTSVTKSFAIGNVGGGSLTWAVSEFIPWLTVSRTSGTGSATVTVTVDRSALSTGSYTGLINVSSNGGNETVTVTMEVVAEPVLGVSPTFLHFFASASNGALSIWNAGGGTLHWNISTDQPWLSATPSSGTGDDQVAVNVYRAGLSDGTYYGNLFVTSNGGNATISVEMIVSTQAILNVNPNLLVFTPSVQMNTFSISNAGIGVLSWSITVDEPWISVVPPLSGSGSAVVTVTVDPASVPCCGMQTGHVRVTSNGGAETVEVRAYPTGPPSGGSLGIYADVLGADCNLPDQTPGLTTYHVVHLCSAGVTASAYRAPKPACFTGTWMSDTNIFPVTIGNSQDGVSIGYGACRTGPLHVQSIVFFANGNTPECCLYPVLGMPASGNVEVVDCANTLISAYGVTSVVNATGGCPCGSVRVEESTWGRVKSLYSTD